jgi:hypothetical protein
MNPRDGCKSENAPAFDLALKAAPPAGVATLVLRNLISRQEMLVEEAREDSSRGGWTCDWGSAHRELQAEIEKTIAAIRPAKDLPSLQGNPRTVKDKVVYP